MPQPTAEAGPCAKNHGGTWQLSGTKTVVPAGAHAGAFIVPARVSGAVDDETGIALFLVSKGEKGVTVRGYPTQDGACAADITLTEADAIELLPAGVTPWLASKPSTKSLCPCGIRAASVFDVRSTSCAMLKFSGISTSMP